MKYIALGAVMAAISFSANAASLKGIDTLDKSVLDAEPAHVVKSDENMIVTSGQGGKVGGGEAFISSDKHFSVGLAKYDKLTLQLKNWPVDEFMYILEGQLEITDANGKKIVYGPGDSFVMHKGFNGTWRQLAPIKKIAVSYNPK